MKATSILFVLMISLMSGVNNEAHAGIYKCVDSSGGISYSSEECPAEERTAKVMSKSGRGGSKVSCEVADAFIRKTASEMRKGKSSTDVFSQYGGLNRIPKPSLNMINYIYTFKENLTVVPSRIIDLTLQKCSVGNFGVPTCNSLPASFLNDNGGCTVDTTSTNQQPESEQKHENVNREQLR